MPDNGYGYLSGLLTRIAACIRVGAMSSRTWHLFARKFPDGSLRDVASRERLELMESSRPIVPVFVEELGGDHESPEVTHYGIGSNQTQSRFEHIARRDPNAPGCSGCRDALQSGKVPVPLKVTELRAMFRLVP